MQVHGQSLLPIHCQGQSLHFLLHTTKRTKDHTTFLEHSLIFYILNKKTDHVAMI